MSSILIFYLPSRVLYELPDSITYQASLPSDKKTIFNITKSEGMYKARDNRKRAKIRKI